MSSFVSSLVKKVWNNSVGGLPLDGFKECQSPETASSPTKHSYFVLKTVVRSTDHLKCTLFSCGEAPIRECEWPFIKSSLKRLKTLRHPHILKYLDSKESPKNGMFFATEFVLPMRSVSDWKPEEVVAGLWNVLDVLSFMHEKCQLFHGSIGMHSVFVTASREMKVGLFDVTAEASLDNYEYFNNLRTSSCLKELENLFDSVSVKTLTKEAIDGLLLCKLFNEILSSRNFTHEKKFVEECHSFLKKLDQDSRRTSFTFGSQLAALKKSLLIKSYGSLLNVCQFLDEYAIKSTFEKDFFLKNLMEDCGEKHIPSTDFLKYRLLPTVMSSINSSGLKSSKSDAKGLLASEVYTFLKVSPMLPSDEYDAVVLPLIIDLFGVLDRGIRLMLLESLELHLNLISKSVLNEKIYPLLISGFNDAHPLVREQTLKAIVVLGPKLKSKLLNGDVLRFIARLQTDQQAGIRINATVSLGKISGYLEEKVAKKVLLAGFTRVLNDEYYQCKISGLKALAATGEIYEVEDICTKILPAVTPLIIDDSKEVREVSLETHAVFWDIARKYSQAIKKDIVVAEEQPREEEPSESSYIPQHARSLNCSAVSASEPAMSSRKKSIKDDENQNQHSEDYQNSALGVTKGIKSMQLKLSPSQTHLEEVLDGWGDVDDAFDDHSPEVEKNILTGKNSHHSFYPNQSAPVFKTSQKRMSLKLGSPQEDFNPWK